MLQQNTKINDLIYNSSHYLSMLAFMNTSSLCSAPKLANFKYLMKST